MNFPNGKVMAGVMMAITTLIALLMEGTVVEMMSRKPSAVHVNAFNNNFIVHPFFFDFFLMFFNYQINMDHNFEQE